jgi:hypothetical protein
LRVAVSEAIEAGNNGSVEGTSCDLRNESRACTKWPDGETEKLGVTRIGVASIPRETAEELLFWPVYL